MCFVDELYSVVKLKLIAYKIIKFLLQNLRFNVISHYKAEKNDDMCHEQYFFSKFAWY